MCRRLKYLETIDAEEVPQPLRVEWVKFPTCDAINRRQPVYLEKGDLYRPTFLTLTFF